MFRKEGIFSRWVDHVPQYNWPISVTSHNVTSWRKELHKKSEPRFEIRMSRTWLKELKLLRRDIRWAPEMINTKTEKRRSGGDRKSLLHTCLSGSSSMFPEQPLRMSEVHAFSCRQDAVGWMTLPITKTGTVQYNILCRGRQKLANRPNGSRRNVA